jgi:hypothetical protein
MRNRIGKDKVQVDAPSPLQHLLQSQLSPAYPPRLSTWHLDAYTHNRALRFAAYDGSLWNYHIDCKTTYRCFLSGGCALLRRIRIAEGTLVFLSICCKGVS